MSSHKTAFHARQISAQEIRGWGPRDALGHSLNQSVSLIIGKEKDLVLFDGATESAAELILVIGAPFPLVKEIRGVEIRIPQELEKTPMKLVCAGLGHDVDQSAAIIPV